MTEMSGPLHTRLLDMALIKPHSLTPSTPLGTTSTQDSPGQVLFPAGLANLGALVHEWMWFNVLPGESGVSLTGAPFPSTCRNRVPNLTFSHLPLPL